MPGPRIRASIAGATTGAGIAQLGVTLGALSGGWSIVIGAALGGLMGLLGRRDQRIGTEKPSIRANIRSAISAVRWVVGESRVGGVIVFARSTTPAKRSAAGESFTHADLHLAMLISEGPCEGIRSLRIDGKRVSIDRVARSGAGQSGHWIVPRAATGYQGRVLVAEYFDATGNQGDSLWAACAGDQSETDQPEWTPAHRLEGKSWVHVWIRQGRNRTNADGEFIEGISDGVKFEKVPAFEFTLRGARITWPGQPVATWTENAIALRHWFLTKFRGLSADLVDETSFGRAFGIADHSLSWPAFQDYPTSGIRYGANGVVESDDDPDTIEGEFDWNTQGGAPEVGGRRVFIAGGAPVPTLAITDAELLSIEGGSIAPPLARRVNRLTCQLPQSAPQGNEPLSLAYQNSVQLARDGVPITQDLGARAFVSDPYAGGRLMAVASRLYAGRVWTVLIRPTLLTLEGLRVGAELTLSSARQSLPDIPCFVDDFGIDPDWSIRAVLREIPEEAFADTIVQPPPLTDATNRRVVVVRTFGGASHFDGSLVDLYEWEHGFNGWMLIPEGDFDAATTARVWDGVTAQGAAEWPFGLPSGAAAYHSAEIDSGGAHFDSVLVSPRWSAPPGVPAASIQRQTGIVSVDVFDPTTSTWGHVRQGPTDTYIGNLPASRTKVRISLPWNVSAVHRAQNVALAGLSVTLAVTPDTAGDTRTAEDDEYLTRLPDFTI